MLTMYKLFRAVASGGAKGPAPHHEGLLPPHEKFQSKTTGHGRS